MNALENQTASRDQYEQPTQSPLTSENVDNLINRNYREWSERDARKDLPQSPEKKSGKIAKTETQHEYSGLFQSFQHGNKEEDKIEGIVEDPQKQKQKADQNGSPENLSEDDISKCKEKMARLEQQRTQLLEENNEQRQVREGMKRQLETISKQRDQTLIQLQESLQDARRSRLREIELKGVIAQRDYLIRQAMSHILDLIEEVIDRNQIIQDRLKPAHLLSSYVAQVAEGQAAIWKQKYIQQNKSTVRSAQLQRQNQKLSGQIRKLKRQKNLQQKAQLCKQVKYFPKRKSQIEDRDKTYRRNKERQDKRQRGYEERFEKHHRGGSWEKDYT